MNFRPHSSGAGGLARALFWLLLALLVVRIATLGTYVLYDTTEARYGEVARLMLATGDWITPQNEPGVAFWAKPPMYAWAGAASMAVFGVNEFAVRLPSVLFCGLTLMIVVAWGNAVARRRGADVQTLRSEGLAAALILGTMALYFVSAGAIMTEATLVLATTWILAAFWFTVVDGSRAPQWRWGFFIALGIGMLAKGPVALVYPGMGIFLWVLVRNAWLPMWRQLPWLRGLLLAALMSAPWYVAAELRTPGYWYYFFVGEHFMRFTQPGWGGDLYGTAHNEPRGRIWLFWFGATLPWIVAALAGTARWILRRVRSAGATLDDSVFYLVLAAIIPLCFFTIARNIIWTYALPTLPPLALLIAPMVTRAALRSRGWRTAITGAMVACIVLYAVTFAVILPRYADGRSSASIVRDWQRASAAQPGALVFVNQQLPHSAKFYSRATARALDGEHAAALIDGPVVYFVFGKGAKDYDGAKLPPEFAGRVDLVSQQERYALYRTAGPH